MTLPSTGIITLSQVNTELGRSATAFINMNDSAVRTLANVGGASTVISMQNLRGKNSVVPGFDNAADFSIVRTPAFINSPLIESITFLSNGQISAVDSGPTRYFSPIITGNGSDIEIQVAYSVSNYSNGGFATVFGTQVFSYSSQTGVVSYTSLATAKTIQIQTNNAGDEPISISFTVTVRKISTGATVSRNGIISIS